MGLAKRSLLLLAMLSVCVAVVGQQPIAADDSYQRMMAAIDAWLADHEEPTFESPSAEQVFRWRVDIEKLSYDRAERFAYFSKLLTEIGDIEFTYLGNVYNNRSLRALLVEYYPGHGPESSVFFGEMYAWYKGNVTTKREQIYWLRLFLDFLRDLDESDARKVVNSCLEQIKDVIKQYLALVQYYVTEAPKEIEDINTVYTAPTLGIRVYFDYVTDPKDLLRILANLANSEVGKLLPNDIKAMVVRFAVPAFADTDAAVHIYAAWGDSQ